MRKLANEIITNEIKFHITKEMEKYMAPLNESIDRLASAISTELQQVRDEMQSTVDSLGAENEDLRAQLQGHVDSIDNAKNRIDTMSSDLEANDPAPEEPPVEEPPVEEPPAEEPVA